MPGLDPVSLEASRERRGDRGLVVPRSGPLGDDRWLGVGPGVAQAAEAATLAGAELAEALLGILGGVLAIEVGFGGGDRPDPAV